MLYIKRSNKKLISLLALAIPWLFSLPANATNEFGEHGSVYKQCLPHDVYNQNHYQTSKGCYLHIQSLARGGITVTSPLLTGYRAPKLLPRTHYKDYQVSSANLFRNDGVMIGEVILVTRDNGDFLALVDTALHQDIVFGKADGTQTLREGKKYNYLTPDFIISPKQMAEANAEAKKHYPKIDANGVSHITVLAGLSQAAVLYVGDATAYALAEIETVNLGLRNSRVSNVRVELAGLEFTPVDRPITQQTIRNLQEFFPNQVRADLIAGFFLGNPSQNEAGGLGDMPGRLSIQTVTWNAIFRHEAGHNAGGNHCNNAGVDNFRFGFNETILCQGGLSIYSTPLVMDSFGRPLGNARTADMARQWREFAPTMSSWGVGGLPPMPNAFRLDNSMFRDRCVDAIGPLQLGTSVGISPCAFANNHQGWTADNTGRLRLAANQALCIGFNGSITTIQSCSINSNTIIWRESNGSFINTSNNQCLNPQPNAPSYTWLNLSTCNNTNAQRWIRIPFNSIPAPPPISQPFRLENRGTRGQCLDILGGDPQRVGSFICQANSANQRWVTDNTGRVIWNANRNLCLGGNGDGGFVTLQNCSSTDTRILWRESNENYINVANNQLLNPLSNAASNARVTLNPATGSAFQRWARINL